MENWTEMITAMALTNTKDDPFYQKRFLRQSPSENPTVLQLGGSDPAMLRNAVKIVLASQEMYGRWEGINLNCGCPSDKVTLKGCFGARLMESPALVGECVKEMMEEAASVPQGPQISVKCRIGVDDNDDYEDLLNFVKTVHEISDCQVFQVGSRSFNSGLLVKAPACTHFRSARVARFILPC